MNKDKISLTRLMEEEGIDVKRLGNYSMALCVFHSDNNPSMAIYEDKFFVCFACQAKGDCIDWIREYKGFGFKQACEYLGIDNIKVAKKKREVKSLIQLIADEELHGVDTKNKYGKEFIDTLLAKEIIRRLG